MDPLILSTGITLSIAVYSLWVILRQQKTIDKLTDKLMAKDLTEYRRGSVPIPQEPTLRKPISFYDDPSIELDNKVT